MDLIKHRINPDPAVICSPADHEKYCRYLKALRVDFLKRYQKDISINANESEFKLDKIINEGNMSILYLAKKLDYDEDGKEKEKLYVFKIMDKGKLLNLKSGQCSYEKKALNAIRFPFVVHMEYYLENFDNITYVLPYISGGDMFDYLQKTGRLIEDRSKFYAAQILLGLEYLHACHLVYRSLKPENILIDSKGYLKLTDFGSCKQVDTRTWSLCGTPEYLAPEMILCKGYGYAVDWWAFGVLLFEINSGYSPFWAHTLLKMYEKIVYHKYKYPGHFSFDLRNLISHLLEPDITRRYGNLKNGTNDLKTHKWFKTINWNHILLYKATPPFVPKEIATSDDIGFDDDFIFKQDCFCSD